MQYRHQEALQRLKFEKAAAHMEVRLDGKCLASSKDVILLHEASYPPVVYFPREDVDFSFLERTKTQTICPFKGVACYYAMSDEVGGMVVPDIAWSYEAPINEADMIAGYISFYPDKVHLIEVGR